MVRRRRRAQEQASGVPRGGGPAAAPDSLLSLGDTHASDAFSFLPPGQPAGGAGGRRAWGLGLHGAWRSAAGLCCRKLQAWAHAARWLRGFTKHACPGRRPLQSARLTMRRAC